MCVGVWERAGVSAGACVCVCVCACVRACVRACARARVEVGWMGQDVHACIRVEINKFSRSHTEKSFPDAMVSIRAISGMVTRASWSRTITLICIIKTPAATDIHPMTVSSMLQTKE